MISITITAQVDRVQDMVGVNLQDGSTPEERAGAFAKIRAVVDELEKKTNAAAAAPAAAV
jgi:hypothetical protein